MNAAEHLYKEMMDQMGRSGNGIIRDSLERQGENTLAWIESCLTEIGEDQTGEFLLDLIAMNQTYSGVRPLLDGLVGSANHLRENNVARDSAQFRAEIESAGDEDLWRTFDMVDGLAVERENRAYEPDKAEVHPYKERFDAMKLHYDDAVAEGNKSDEARYAGYLDKLIAEIKQFDEAKDNPPVKPEPVKPEAKPKSNPDEYDASPGFVPDMTADEATEMDSDGNEHFA